MFRFPSCNVQGVVSCVIIKTAINRHNGMTMSKICTISLCFDLIKTLSKYVCCGFCTALPLSLFSMQFVSDILRKINVYSLKQGDILTPLLL